MLKKIRDKSLLSEFIIEYAAAGLSAEQIVLSVQDKLDLEISAGDISQLITAQSDAVARRTAVFRAELSDKSPFILARMDRISRELEDKMQSASDDNYARLVSPYLKSLDSFSAELRKFQESEAVFSSANSTLDNISTFEYLEERGALKVLDKDILLKELKGGF